MAAMVLPQSREVSTSSAATTQSGGFLARAEPGKTANLVPQAPRYSGRGRRPRAGAGAPGGAAPARAVGSTTFIPTCESRPASSAVWIRTLSDDDDLVLMPSSRES